MTIVVTRNVSNRIRGFLASSMLELAPGVYSGARLSPAVRNRIWSVLVDWFSAETDASIVMVWREPQMPGGQSVLCLGTPPLELVELDGVVLTKKPTAESDASNSEPVPDPAP